MVTEAEFDALKALVTILERRCNRLLRGVTQITQFTRGSDPTKRTHQNIYKYSTLTQVDRDLFYADAQTELAEIKAAIP